MLMSGVLDADDWYNPHIINPKFAIQPPDIELNRALYREFHGNSLPLKVPLQTVAERPLAESPWLLGGGRSIFNSAARAVISSVATPGDVRWLPLVIQTPSGAVDDYQVAAPSPDGPNVLSEAHTTRDPRGAPIRWVLDSRKLGDRQVLMVPGIASAGLIMRGRVLRHLLDLGAKGIDIRPARIARSV
jgi:hypothetical protein